MVGEEMMKQMPHVMGQGMNMMSHPVAKGAMMAASGFAAGRGLLGASLFRTPLLLLAGGIAGGIAAGYLLHRHEKEVVEALSKLSGMGKDFVLQQRENLDDLIAEAKEPKQTEGATAAHAPATTPAATPTTETETKA